ncbi:DcaP family trimeric outer membrane transporter [Halospina sp. K52047b]|uniref:DcaP family trimeric outer membrane transporter n=1 Tax=Halospina sp. K52047b TaxID=2614160 RepID=UPI00124A554E|nr:DcaP family trimeric outer membrane transporter [Halospina sp. K52047b]KAA8984447.1 hypothetical protein F3089_03605 [Halospina sp. K52047b]
MKTTNMTLAVRATTAAMILGTAGQANAVDFTAGSVEGSVYGFARVAASYDLDEDINPGGGRAANFSGITTGNADTSSGHFGMDTTTSRLGLSVTTPQDLKIVMETDFEGDNGDGAKIRLRKAYGEYKGVLVGRTWSNYNSFVAFSPTLDFDAMPGATGTFFRTEQIRYTSGPVSVSLEEPIVLGGGVEGGTDKTASPVLTAKLADSMEGLSYATGVMAKQTAFDNASSNTPANTDDDSAIGYGAFVAANMALTDAFSVNVTMNYADGANSYVYRAGGAFGQPDAYVDGGEVETIEAYAGTLGATMDFGGGQSVNAGYGTATSDLDDAVSAGALDPTDTDTNTMVFVNYKWTPVENVTMGVEFANLETETQGGNDGDANRLMYLAQYSF